MKKTIFTLLLTAVLGSANGQTFSITKGPELKTELGTFSYYVGQDGNNLYSMRYARKSGENGEILQKIDLATLQTAYTTPLEFSFSTIHIVKNKVYTFLTKYDKKAKTKYFLVRESDARTGKPIGEEKQIMAFNMEPGEAERLKFYTTFSPDDSKLAIITEYTQPEKAAQAEVRILEVAGFRQSANKKLIDAYKNSTISSSNYRVDNNGTFYYLFNYMIDFEEQIGGLALASIAENESKSVVTPLPFDKLEIMNGTFTFVKNDLVFCGIFKDVVTKKERKAGKIKDVGVYTFFIDGKTSQVKNKGFDYFSADVKEKLTYADGLIQKSPADKYYSFEEIINFNNCTYLIESHSYAISSNNSYTSYERELIVSKFNSEGKMEWMRIIPKFTANGLNEFNYIVKNDKVYLFYAEHPKNLEKSTVTDYDPKRYHDIKNYNGSWLVCTSFDERGTLNRKEILRNEGWCYDPNSTNILTENKDGLIVRMINKEKERYDKITINE